MAILALLLLVPWLWIGCREDPERTVRNIYEMQSDPTPENRERIRESLDHPDPGVRATALHVLVGLGVDDGAELAIRSLSDPDPFVRMIGAGLLGDLRSSDAAGLLGERLREDEDWHVRQKAAEALGEIGGKAASNALKYGFDDPIAEVRRASVMSVAKVAPSDALDRLLLLLQEDKDWEVRVQAARALADLGRAEALPVLEKVLYEDTNRFVQAAVARAIKVLKGESTGSP